MLLTAVGHRLQRAITPQRLPESASPLTHLLWFCDGLMLFFLVSWGCTQYVQIDNDLYYAVFIWTGLTFLYYYRRATNSHVLLWIAQRWRLSLVIGALTAVYMAVNVWNSNPTERPGGLLLSFELVWRGLAYGVVSSLILTGFPFAVAIGILARHDAVGQARRVALSSLTVVLVWVMSTSYHQGFSQYDGNRVAPQLQTAALSVPVIVTANPVGSVLAHTTLHVTATLRTFESDVFVPPSVNFDPAYEPPGVFRPEPDANGSRPR